MQSAATDWRGSLMRAALGAGALALAVAACGRNPTDTCAPCGGAFRADPARQAQITAEWRRVAHQLGQQPALDFRCSCFGGGASTSVEGQNLYLPDDWELSEQTARAAHLAQHRNQPPWTAAASASCEARVEQALAREADAHAVELETRRALHVSHARYPFESDFFTIPVGERRAWLYDYLVAHPQGDGVVPGFATLYRARCQ